MLRTYLYEDELIHSLLIPVGARTVMEINCLITVCKNGKKPYGTYCGVGGCNVFGCNCDGGCIQGDAVVEFKSRHPDIIWARRERTFDNI